MRYRIVSKKPQSGHIVPPPQLFDIYCFVPLETDAKDKHDPDAEDAPDDEDEAADDVDPPRHLHTGLGSGSVEQTRTWVRFFRN